MVGTQARHPRPPNQPPASVLRRRYRSGGAEGAVSVSNALREAREDIARMRRAGGQQDESALSARLVSIADRLSGAASDRLSDLESRRTPEASPQARGTEAA